MPKLIQICASENDLFGLDGDGIVYQYNFKMNNWMSLGHGRDDHEEPPVADERTPSRQPRSRNASPSARG
jgi:hypothetical protein